MEDAAPWNISQNVLAAAVGFRNFRAQGHFRPQEAWPWLGGGVLGAVVGAMLPIEPGVFRGLLAITLSGVAVYMIRGKTKPSGSNDEHATRRVAWAAAVLLGAIVGVLSGIVGIGGGIILGPIILGFNFGEPKPTAALTSLYILLSSTAALSSHVVQGGAMDLKLISVTGAAVVVGSFLGSRFGASRASPSLLRRTFGVLVLIAGARLLIEMISAIR